MKCANCGMPLSPARANCPRCGAAAGVGGKASKPAPVNAGAVQQVEFATGGWPPAQQSWGVQSAVSPWQIQNTQNTPFGQTIQADFPQQMGQEGYGQQPFPGEQGQAFPISSANVLQEQGKMVLPAQGWGQSGQPTISADTEAPLSFTQAPRRAAGSSPLPRAARMRFTIAGLCVFTGALLLLFVFFMAQGLSNTPDTQAVSLQGAITATVPNAATTQGTATPQATTTPDASPTATYAGQKYIDNAQTASMVNARSAQATQPSTTFKVNQQVFVTFSVHSGTVAGAACLIWYLNHTEVTHYEMVVAPNINAYSYAYIGGPGPAYVEIYWASTKACTDKVLAQHVDFTVSR